MRKRLAVLVVAFGALLPLGIHAAQAGPIKAKDGRHWACVGELDVNIGICIDNPIPPPPF